MSVKNKKPEEQSLENFEWDTENNFFGIEGSGVETPELEATLEKVKEKDEEELKTETEIKDKKSEPKETDEDDDEGEDVSFFEQEKDKPKGEEGEQDEEDDDDDEPESLEQALKEALLSGIELPEGEELTREKLDELIEQRNDALIEEAFNGVKEQGGEQAAEYLKYLASGGDPIEYHRLWKEAAEAPTGLDITQDDGQDEVIKFYLKNYTKTTSKEDINDHLEWLEEKGKKKAYAEKYQREIDADFEKRKTELVENQKNAVKLHEQKRKEAVTKIKDTLLNSEKIGSLVITKQDKSGRLLDDMTKATVKIGENNYITPLQSKLGECFKDPQKLIQLAKFVMSDFDTSDIETQAATKVTKNVRKKLVTSSGKLSSQPKSRVRNLSDFF